MNFSSIDNFNNYPEAISGILKSLTLDKDTIKLFTEYGKKINESISQNPDKYVLSNYSQGSSEMEGFMGNLMEKLQETINENPSLASSFVNFAKEFSDKYGDTVRVVEIPGFSIELCGGTHVKSTAEVGFIKLKRERNGKNVERVYITLDDPLLGSSRHSHFNLG